MILRLFQDSVDIGLAEALLEAGADVSVQDSQGRTARHIAILESKQIENAISRRSGIVRLISGLLAAGADVNAKAVNGDTPHSIASSTQVGRENWLFFFNSWC